LPKPTEETSHQASTRLRHEGEGHQREEEVLRQAEQTSRAILNSVPAHIAVVNHEGVITAVNEEWEQFVQENGDPLLAHTEVGTNYFESCRQASSAGVAEAQKVLAGMLSIRDERAEFFELEYPCPTPTGERWFLLRVRSLVGVLGSLVVSHIDTTPRKRAEQAEAEARAHADRLAQLEAELRWFERVFGSAPTLLTAQAFGLSPLSKSQPEIFSELVQRYETVLDLALEQHAYKVEHNIPERLRLLGEQLGFLHAGPRDVIELHRTALQQKTGGVGAAPQKTQAYVAEGRLLVLELMGDLVSYYRKLAMGAKKVP
jgi:hypothetical protein